jgi:hypothetical protein
MNTVWWKVKPPIDDEFLVLVVEGRVAVAQKFYGLISIGEPWKSARRELESYQFKCVMVPA